MAATQILPTASSAADSADVVVAAGTPLTVGLKGAVDNAALVSVFIKDDTGGYNFIGTIDPTTPAVEITAPGTYRFTRRAGATCGVFSA
jgi:hypothetical protein